MTQTEVVDAQADNALRANLVDGLSLRLEIGDGLIGKVHNFLINKRNARENSGRKKPHQKKKMKSVRSCFKKRRKRKIPKIFRINSQFLTNEFWLVKKRNTAQSLHVEMINQRKSFVSVVKIQNASKNTRKQASGTYQVEIFQFLYRKIVFLAKWIQQKRFAKGMKIID